MNTFFQDLETGGITENENEMIIHCFIFTITKEEKKTVRKSLPISKLKILLTETVGGQWYLPMIPIRKTNFHTSIRSYLKNNFEITNISWIEQINFFFSPKNLLLYPNIKKEPFSLNGLFFVALNWESIQNNDFLNGKSKLFPIEEVKNMNILNEHRKMLFGEKSDYFEEQINVYEWLQKKTLTSTFAKAFLPNEFTLSELYLVIQSIIPYFDEKLSNFERKLLKKKTGNSIITEAIDEFNEIKTSNAYSNSGAKLYKFCESNPIPSVYK